MNLFLLDAEIRAITDAILNADGEVTDDQNDALDSLLDAREDKWQAYIAVIREAEASAEAIKNEEDRLKKLRAPHENLAARLKARVFESMVAAGERKHETPIGTLRIQKSGTRPVVMHVDPEDLPERFRRVKVDADKRALMDALKDGDPEAMVCAELGEASEYLRLV